MQKLFSYHLHREKRSFWVLLTCENTDNHKIWWSYIISDIFSLKYIKFCVFWVRLCHVTKIIITVIFYEIRKYVFDMKYIFPMIQTQTYFCCSALHNNDFSNWYHVCSILNYFLFLWKMEIGKRYIHQLLITDVA